MVAVFYVVPAMMIAAPIYLVAALASNRLAMLPNDQSDVLVLVAIAAVFYVPWLFSAPARLGLAEQ
jgi:hypothetical protein